MKVSFKQFIYALNLFAVIAVSALLFYIYTQQRENLVRVIGSHCIKSTLIQNSYIFSKILNDENDSYILKPFLDRKVASSDIIKGFIVSDGKKVLIKSGKIENKIPDSSKVYSDIYNIDLKALTSYSVFKKDFSFYDGTKRRVYSLYLFTDKKYVLSLLEGLKTKYLLIWLGVIAVLFFIVHFLVKRCIIEPIEYLKLFAQKKVTKKKNLHIKEFNTIETILKRTFDQLDSQIGYLYDVSVTDSLTGLGNRKFLYEYLHSKLKSDSNEFAVALVDLDNFKDINDYYGHNMGDEVLKKVAEVLKSSINSEDKAVRIGGDEFVLVINSVKGDELRKLFKRILKRLNAVWKINSEEVLLSASIGVSMFPQNGSTIHELLKNADIALYEAKKKGKNRIVNFNDELKEQIEKQVVLKNKLKKALDNDEFEMYYQAKVDRDGKIRGCEALIRWFSDGRMVSPAEFIPVAERSGFMYALGEWIAKDVMKTRKEWNENGFMKDISIAFNVSAVQLKNEKFLRKFKKYLDETGCGVKGLEIEITESAFVENRKTAQKIINEFHEMGVKINLDDFGTGYSSLSFLREFCVDVIKIDKSFVDHVLQTRGEIYINTMINMAKNLSLKTVAEGVENKEQFELLKELGVDCFQGYYFAKPLNKEEFEKLVRSSKHGS